MVPGGEGVDWDIFAEEAVRLGLPPGIIGELAEKAKTDPEVERQLLDVIKVWQNFYKENPDMREKLSKGMQSGSPNEEDFPEDFGGDQGAF